MHMGKSLMKFIASEPTMPNQTNYLSLSRCYDTKGTSSSYQFLSSPLSRASIKGSFTINPYLDIPDTLLYPGSVSDNESRSPIKRKNLDFETNTGGINVNVFITSSMMGIAKSRFTSLSFKANGDNDTGLPLIAKIRAQGSNSDRLPLRIIATAIDGFISLHLPTTFHGLILVKAIFMDNIDSHISLSSTLNDGSTIISERKQVGTFWVGAPDNSKVHGQCTIRSYFVGKLRDDLRDDLHQGKWGGDKLSVDVGTGKVRLQMLGEKGYDKLRVLKWQNGY